MGKKRKNLKKAAGWHDNTTVPTSGCLFWYEEKLGIAEKTEKPLK